jgi:hypothetical protein
MAHKGRVLVHVGIHAHTWSQSNIRNAVQHIDAQGVAVGGETTLCTYLLRQGLPP